jgi:hypothetical protein
MDVGKRGTPADIVVDGKLGWEIGSEDYADQ